MLITIRINFQSEKKFTADCRVFDSCRDGQNYKRESQNHLMICKAYKSFRVGKGCSKDKDLVDFFKFVAEHQIMNA